MDESLKQKRASETAVERTASVSGDVLERARASVRRFVASRRAGLVCACLLTLMAANMLAVVARKSITTDEIVLIPAAYYHLVASDPQLVHEHPPLCKLLAGLPLLFIQPDEVTPEQIAPSATTSERKWAYEARFWQDNRARFETISYWTRVPMILLTLCLGALVYFFARDLFGARAAVFAVALFALEPTVLAHGRVVQTDIPATFGYLLVFYALQRYTRALGWRRAAWLGAAGGVALLGKFSMLIVGPILLAVFLFLIWRAPRRGELSRTTLAAHAGLALLALLAVVNAAYFFHSRALTADDLRWFATSFSSAGDTLPSFVRALSYIVPTDFILGILFQLLHSHDGHNAALLGMYSRTGWWYYFPVAFALKTTLPFLLLSVASLSWSAWSFARTRERRFLFLLLPFTLYTAYVMMSSINIGVRYYLPAYPFLFIMSGAMLERMMRLRRARIAGMIVAIALLGWCGIETWRAYPNYMPYMNQLASSRAPRWWYLSDSNIEWGDDASELAAYLHARGERRVRAVLLGGFLTLGYYDVEYIDMLSPAVAEQTPTRYVAIGASFLNGSTVPERAGMSEDERVNFFEEYRRRTPEAIIGGSIYLYRLHE